MTRKDFELIAHALKVAHTLLCTDTANDKETREFCHAVTCGSVADQLASTNARFDRERFLTACGV